VNATTLHHGIILLAAGASRRLGTSKQLLRIDHEPLVRRAARIALTTRPTRIAVVVGADAEATFAAVSDLNVERVDCADWALGMGASLRAGTRALQEDCDGLLIVLCDQPALSAAHLQRLVEAWRSAPQRRAASAYAGTLGVPALLPRPWFADLLRLEGDQGARALLRDQVQGVIAIPAPELAWDIDDPAAARGSGAAP